MANVFIPGMERFMVVTDGHLVLPGARGLAARPSVLQSQGLTT